MMSLLLWSVLSCVIILSDALEYSNRWTVQIDGDNEEANRLARKHGFVNQGKVRRLKLRKDCLYSIYNQQ